MSAGAIVYMLLLTMLCDVFEEQIKEKFINKYFCNHVLGFNYIILQSKCINIYIYLYLYVCWKIHLKIPVRNLQT